jgi:hypothetical protein
LIMWHFRCLKGSVSLPKVPNISQHWEIHCSSNRDCQLQGRFSHMWLAPRSPQTKQYIYIYKIRYICYTL